MAEVNTAVTYHVAFTPREYKLVMKTLALAAGLVRRMDVDEQHEAARLNKAMLENQKTILEQQLALTTAALEKANGVEG